MIAIDITKRCPRLAERKIKEQTGPRDSSPEAPPNIAVDTWTGTLTSFGWGPYTMEKWPPGRCGDFAVAKDH